MGCAPTWVVGQCHKGNLVVCYFRLFAFSAATRESKETMLLACCWIPRSVFARHVLCGSRVRTGALEAALKDGSGAFLYDVLGSEGGTLPTRCVASLARR